MSPPRRRRTREEQRAETRQRLLDAAAEVFAARGVEAAAIDEISERAGYSRGAFYSNFTGKAELLVALCEQRLRAFNDELVPTLRATPEGGRVRRAAELVAELVADRDAGDVLLLVELARLRGTDPQVDRLLAGFAGQLTALVAAELRDPSFDLGDPDDREIEAGARALVGAVLGVAMLTHLGVEGRQHTAELLLEGALRAAFPRAAYPDDAAGQVGVETGSHR